MIEHRLFAVGDARAFTPTTSENDEAGIHGALAQSSMADWSWKPHRYDERGRYRLQVIGARCTCTLSQPVGTNCARHN